MGKRWDASGGIAMQKIGIYFQNEINGWPFLKGQAAPVVLTPWTRRMNWSAPVLGRSSVASANVFHHPSRLTIQAFGLPHCCARRRARSAKVRGHRRHPRHRWMKAADHFGM
jgi:hypothetical protein